MGCCCCWWLRTARSTQGSIARCNFMELWIALCAQLCDEGSGGACLPAGQPRRTARGSQGLAAHLHPGQLRGMKSSQCQPSAGSRVPRTLQGHPGTEGIPASPAGLRAPRGKGRIGRGERGRRQRSLINDRCLPLVLNEKNERSG